MLQREKKLRSLPKKVDVLIIGGGINGVGIARECALRGIQVLCIDKHDFASGTSSASSKLAHGGLRYLENFEFKLVMESCQERERLLQNAPYLVKPLPFLLPIYEHNTYSPFKINIGLTLYDGLSFFKTTASHLMLSKEEILKKEPWLEPKGLLGGALYYDAQMDDARLAIDTALQAEQFGATLLNYVEFKRITSEPEHHSVELYDTLSNTTYHINATIVVNASGPWSDMVNHIIDETATEQLRPSKGVHIITKRLTQNHAVLLSTHKDNRVYFVIPWNEYSLIGTTDTDYKEDINHVSITPEDVDYLITETNSYFPHVQLKKSDIISAFSGLRPLLNQHKNTVGSVSREEKIYIKNNIITLIGGKYTTYRAVTEKVTKKIIGCLNKGKRFKSLTKNLNLFYPEKSTFSKTDAAIDYERCHISEEMRQELIRKYGSQYTLIIDICSEDPSLLQRLPQSTRIEAEVIYAIRHTHARTIEDFMRRRTLFMLTEGNGLQVLERVAMLFQSELKWSPEKTELEKNTYKNLVSDMRSSFS